MHGLGHAGLVIVLAVLTVVSGAAPIGPAFDPRDEFERAERARGRRFHRMGFVLRVLALLAVGTYAIAGLWFAFPQLDPVLREAAFAVAGVCADVVFALAFAALSMTMVGHSTHHADRPARVGAVAAWLATFAAGALASMRWIPALRDGWQVAFLAVLVLVPLALACLAQVVLRTQPDGRTRLLGVGALTGGWGAVGLALLVLFMASAGNIVDAAGAWLGAFTLIVVTLAIGACALLLTARTIAVGHRPWKRLAGWAWVAPLGMLAVEVSVFGPSEVLPAASIVALASTAVISLVVLAMAIAASLRMGRRSETVHDHLSRSSTTTDEMRCQIVPKDGKGYEIEVRSATRKWVATVRLDEGNLLVEAYELGSDSAPGAQRVISIWPIASWRRSIEAYPDDLALEVVEELRILGGTV
jgi:MFS family permease